MQKLDSESFLDSEMPVLRGCIICKDYESCKKIYLKDPEKYELNQNCIKLNKD